VAKVILLELSTIPALLERRKLGEGGMDLDRG